MQIKKVVGTAGISVIVLGSTVSPTFAAGHRSNSLRNNVELTLDSKYRNVLKNSDYQGWRDFIAKNFKNREGQRVLAAINSPAKLELYKSSIKLLKEGNYLKAREIRDSLGLVGGLRYGMRTI